MSDATIIMTSVDPATSELDVSMVPDEMGVYAIYDVDEALQYVGLSKQMRQSVEGHVIALGPKEASGAIALIKCLAMPGQSKDALKGVWERWIKDHMDAGGKIPNGNLPESAPGADPRWRGKSPQTTKAPLSLAGLMGTASVDDALEVVSATVQKYPVVIFMKGTPAMPQCGFSAKTVGILRQIGVEYESVNVLDSTANPSVREAVKEFSNWPTIPQLYVKGELVGGADIVSDMFESGELQAQLASAMDASASTQDGTSGAEQAAPASVPKGDIILIDDDTRPTASAISRVLDEQFDLYALQIVDESAAHAGDAGAMEMGLSGESHFTVDIVAPEFEGLSPVQRQQKVFTTLGDLMQKIHALSLVTRTPAETVSR